MIGGLAEWSNAPDLKSGVPERGPGVRIPYPPYIGTVQILREIIMTKKTVFSVGVVVVLAAVGYFWGAEAVELVRQAVDVAPVTTTGM